MASEGDWGFEYESSTAVIITGYSGAGGAVTIPSTLAGRTVVSIGEDAMSYNEDITSVTIPDTVVYIGMYAFAGCTSMESVSFGNSIETIDESGFEGCTALTSVTLPDSLTTLSAFCFYGCSSLESIVIDEAVDYIGDYALRSCGALQSITLKGPEPGYIGELSFDLSPDGMTQVTATVYSLNNWASSVLDNYKDNLATILLYEPYVPPVTVATTNVKVNGTWTKGSIYVKVNGAWVESKKIFIKNNGTWVEAK